MKTKSAAPAPQRRIPLVDALRRIPDFRVPGRTKFPLWEVLAVVVCAMICGATSYPDYALFGRKKRRFLKRFLPLRHGIPSHDQFRYVLKNLDPKRFNAAVLAWAGSIVDLAGDTLALDGKVLRRAFGEDGRRPCIVSALSGKHQVVLSQIRADEKSNEITAIPDLLETLFLKGCLVSIDAAGCQKKHVRKIVERGGDYVISLKGNQSTMHEEIRAFMLNPAFNKSFASARTVDCSRGKVVTRTCWQTAEIDWFEDRAAWKGLRSACMVKSEAYDKKTGETTAETRFFISSLPVDPARALKAIRSHWAIEAMHWVLDMEFDEDRSRARSGHSAENLAMLRHVALNVLRLDRSVFGGINRKRKELTWDEEELYQVMVSA